MTDNKKMGRPKIDDQARKVISAYITEDDIEIIKEQAKKSGKSVSAETASILEEAVRRIEENGSQTEPEN
jgi:hypothetical protein